MVKSDEIRRREAIEALEELDIKYEIINHKAAFTIEDMNQVGFEYPQGVLKNLFLRNAKGNIHYLIITTRNKTADLKKIRPQIESTHLSFASEERLEEHLGVPKGSVSALSILNDETSSICVAFDRDILHLEKVGVHPNDNTATLWLSFDDLRKVIKKHGNPILFIDV